MHVPLVMMGILCFFQVTTRCHKKGLRSGLKGDVEPTQTQQVTLFSWGMLHRLGNRNVGSCQTQAETNHEFCVSDKNIFIHGHCNRERCGVPAPARIMYLTSNICQVSYRTFKTRCCCVSGAKKKHHEEMKPEDKNQMHGKSSNLHSVLLVFRTLSLQGSQDDLYKFENCRDRPARYLLTCPNVEVKKS